MSQSSAIHKKIQVFEETMLKNHLLNLLYSCGLNLGVRQRIAQL